MQGPTTYTLVAHNCLTMDDSSLIYMLVNAVKELKGEIDALKVTQAGK